MKGWEAHVGTGYYWRWWDDAKSLLFERGKMSMVVVENIQGSAGKEIASTLTHFIAIALGNSYQINLGE